MMQTVKAATGFFIPTENISYIASYSFSFIKNYVRRQNREDPKSVIDITRGKKILSAAFLKTGEIILMNTAVDTLNDRIETNKTGRSDNA